MSINSCYDDIGKYNALKVSLIGIVNQLNNANTKFSPVSKTIQSAYSVDDDSTPIIGRIDGLNKDIANTASYITKVVIPAIDQAISNKRRDVFRLEQEEKAKAAAANK